MKRERVKTKERKPDRPVTAQPIGERITVQEVRGRVRGGFTETASGCYRRTPTCRD